MKKNSRVLAQYIRDVEEKTSNFQNDAEPDLYSGMISDAGQACARAIGISKPYIFNITNSALTTQTAILFGAGIYLQSVNNGSSPAISITMGAGAATYFQMLMQTISNPFQAVTWRMSCAQNNAQLDQAITINYSNADGKFFSDPIPISSTVNSFQNIATVRDFEYAVKVDGNTYVTIPVLAQTTVTVTIYPYNIVDAAAAFNGQSMVKEFIAPTLSGQLQVTRNELTPLRRVNYVASIPEGQAAAGRMTAMTQR